MWESSGVLAVYLQSFLIPKSYLPTMIRVVRQVEITVLRFKRGRHAAKRKDERTETGKDVYAAVVRLLKPPWLSKCLSMVDTSVFFQPNNGKLRAGLEGAHEAFIHPFATAPVRTMCISEGK